MDTEQLEVETTSLHTNERKRRWSGRFTRPPRENLSDSSSPSPGDSDNSDHFEQETDGTPQEVVAPSDNSDHFEQETDGTPQEVVAPSDNSDHFEQETDDTPQEVVAPPPSDNSDYFETDDTSQEVAPRRSSRRKIRPASPPKSSSSVPFVKQKKLTENSSLKDIENYYLDKRVKRLNPSLETIYEGSETNNEDVTVMSNRKYRRVIDFKPPTAKNSSKIKKRKMKAKKINSKKNKKVSLKFLMDKLAEVSDD